MRRRLLLAAALLPVAAVRLASAQALRVRRLAILSIAGEGTEEFFAPVLKGLADRGYRRGANLEVTFFTRDASSLSGASNDELALAVVESGPDAIVTVSTQATAALLRRTQSIPIVTSLGDPVASGFARSIARPGGNVTGISQGFDVAAAKGVEAVRILVPGLRRLAVFRGGGDMGKFMTDKVADAATSLGIEARRFAVDDDAAARRAFEGLRGAGIQAGSWMISGANARAAAEDAIRRRFPLVSIGSDMTAVGMLASFTTSIPDFGDRLAAIAARVLAGESPAMIPFELPRVFDIALNVRTARAIDLAIPAEMRLRANRIVE